LNECSHKKEPIMSVADTIRAVGNDFGRLAILDREGKEWTYAKRGPVGKNAIALVQVRGTAVVLIPAVDGQAVVRRNGPGLPQRIIVRFAGCAVPRVPGISEAWWLASGGVYEFEQE
jgi:hypothetical protein